jgi:hypothetical protein
MNVYQRVLNNIVLLVSQLALFTMLKNGQKLTKLSLCDDRTPILTSWKYITQILHKSAITQINDSTKYELALFEIGMPI